jgi:hypothetical protein
VENNVLSHFYHATIVALVWHPYKVALSTFGISEESAGFAMHTESEMVFSDDMHSAVGSERPEMGDVGTTVEPQLEGNGIWW